MGPRGRRFCSRSCSSSSRPPHSAETRAKIGAANGTGPEARRWVGEDVGYMGAHSRAAKVVGDECVEADATCKGRLEIALRRDPVGPVRSDARGRYSLRVEDYERLCASHHRRRDGNLPIRRAA